MNHWNDYGTSPRESLAHEIWNTQITGAAFGKLLATVVGFFLLANGNIALPGQFTEALRARWVDVDRGTRVWRIPAQTSKSKRVRSVLLNDSALEVLKQLGTEGSHAYLFVNAKLGKPYSNIHKVWRQLRAQAGLAHLRIHDLRHQYASFLVNSGRTLYEVQQILGHSDPSVTQRYAHLSKRSLQEAADSANDVIRNAGRKSA
jgi:integrase